MKALLDLEHSTEHTADPQLESGVGNPVYCTAHSPDARFKRQAERFEMVGSSAESWPRNARVETHSTVGVPVICVTITITPYLRHLDL